jgi:hypothetical protein
MFYFWKKFFGERVKKKTFVFALNAHLYLDRKKIEQNKTSLSKLWTMKLIGIEKWGYFLKI